MPHCLAEKLRSDMFTKAFHNKCIVPISGGGPIPLWRNQSCSTSRVVSPTIFTEHHRTGPFPGHKRQKNAFYNVGIPKHVRLFCQTETLGITKVYFVPWLKYPVLMCSSHCIRFNIRMTRSDAVPVQTFCDVWSCCCPGVGRAVTLAGRKQFRRWDVLG